MKLKCDVLLSNFAFKFNLRRYTQVLILKNTGEAISEDAYKRIIEKEGSYNGKRVRPKDVCRLQKGGCGYAGSGTQVESKKHFIVGAGSGRAVQVDPIKPTWKAPGTKRLKLIYDRVLSKRAFKFNLRRYTAGWRTRAGSTGGVPPTSVSSSTERGCGGGADAAGAWARPRPRARRGRGGAGANRSGGRAGGRACGCCVGGTSHVDSSSTEWERGRGAAGVVVAVPGLLRDSWPVHGVYGGFFELVVQAVMARGGKLVAL